MNIMCSWAEAHPSKFHEASASVSPIHYPHSPNMNRLALSPCKGVEATLLPSSILDTVPCSTVLLLWTYQDPHEITLQWDRLTPHGLLQSYYLVLFCSWQKATVKK